MDSVSFFRASVFNSSDAAFQLALKNHEHINFAKRIISAKNKSANDKLDKLKVKDMSCHYTQMQANKYGGYLLLINRIEIKNSDRVVSECDNNGVF
ncbi:hypothetical protein [uncultured Cedecea sp.]|uniref:hypothetical protein n=1 Tax=uncultured Cedecea sp. TaxID=988762 RepID=UPI0026023C59|nr:hypothetical protein [uncultured Cedecea sp.]